MEPALLCMKYILFTFNFVLWCMGGALMSLGIWVRADSNFWEYSDKLPIEQYYQACYITIVVGALLLILGFLGCCGAATDSPCMLLAYFILMLVMVVLELAVTGLVWKIASGDKLDEYLQYHIMKHVEKIRTDWQSRRFLDILQLHLHCCGAESKDDYRAVGERAPESCHDQRTNNLFYHGCSEMMRMWLEKRAAMFGGIALGLTLLQMAALVFSCCLYYSVKSGETEKTYY